MNKTMLLIIAGSLMMTACNNKSLKVHALFVDTTGSTAALKDKNPQKIMNYIKKMLNEKVESGETVVIYPIHSQTASSAPIGEWKMPLDKGDMGDERRRKQAIINIIAEVKSVLFDHSRITSRVRLNTSLFPIFTKVKRLSSKGNVEVTIFSDMLEDNASLCFTDLFNRMEKREIKNLAVKQYDERREEMSIIGTNIKILYPSTVVGDHDLEKIMRKVETFWETFFNEAGANLSISDLS